MTWSATSRAKAHFVCHHDHGHTFFRELAHHFEDLADEFGVKSGGSLVKEHQFRIHGKGAGDGNTLLLTTKELCR